MPRVRTIFVSCGQLTDPEKALGREVARVIASHNMTAFVAEDVHSAGDLNSEVSRAIQQCDAFLAIFHKRGIVTFASYPPAERSSVWMQQEIAVFCYRMFLEQRSLPIRLYAESGIHREGVLGVAIVNPIDFDRDEQVLTGVDAWLKGREFEEHPILARRAERFQARYGQLNEDGQLILELIAAHCIEPDVFALFHLVRDDFQDLLRATDVTTDQLDDRFRDAFAALRGLGLIHVEGSGVTRILIAKQWWWLVHDELRRRGRRN